MYCSTYSQVIDHISDEIRRIFGPEKGKAMKYETVAITEQGENGKIMRIRTTADGFEAIKATWDMESSKLVIEDVATWFTRPAAPNTLKRFTGYWRGEEATSIPV